MGLSPDCLLFTMFALVVSLVDDGVWAVQCRCELVLVEEGDVGFGTGTLIVFVMNERDFLEFGCHGVWRCVLPS